MTQPTQASSARRGLRAWAKALSAEVVALGLALRDPRTPWPARILGAAVVAYALSPVDLIPDFIPVLGQLDDLLLVPLGLWLVLRLVPEPVMAEARARAAGLDAAPSRAGAIAIVALWLAGLALTAWLWRTRGQ